MSDVVAHPAFKEWNVIVEALGAGEQLLILRKGGISEGRGGFQTRTGRFWLYPTHFHAQLQKTKPLAARWFTPSVDGTHISVRYFGEIAKHAYLTDWQAVDALDSLHLWTRETVRERFEWSKNHGIHALVVRIHAVDTPQVIPVTEEMGGCKSWVELPLGFDAVPSRPVLSDEQFSERLASHVF